MAFSGSFTHHYAFPNGQDPLNAVIYEGQPFDISQRKYVIGDQTHGMKLRNSRGSYSGERMSVFHSIKSSSW